VYALAFARRGSVTDRTRDAPVDQRKRCDCGNGRAESLRALSNPLETFDRLVMWLDEQMDLNNHVLFAALTSSQSH
jgi:hypothetical protein